MSQTGDGHPAGQQQERRLTLSGAVNFRDLGGYRSRGGRHTAWKRLYRADALSDLTDLDLEALAKLRLRSICDFRLETERRHKPDRLPPGTSLQVHTISFAPEGTLDMWRDIKAGRLSIVEAEARMEDHYRRFAIEHAAEYRRMLDMLLTPDALPALIHCTSGKDRTGFAAAVILMALDIPRETIVEDYLLSDRYRRDLSHLFSDAADPGVVGAITQAHPRYLAAAFDAIDQRWGSEQAYLREGLGLSEAGRQKLQALLLEAD